MFDLNTQQPGTEEWLRSELLRLGAREFEIAALTLVSQRGSSALKYALMKGAEHPIAYAIKIFDDPEWHPAGEKPRVGVNLSAGNTQQPLPAPDNARNLAEARKILAMLNTGGEK